MNIKKFSKIGYGILIAILLLVGGLLLVSSIPVSGNYKVKIVLSGSMEPSIKVGSIVVIKPVDNYEINDVITFGKDDRENIPTTHRIIEMRIIEGETMYMTKGDANEDEDFREVRENEIIGKVLFDIPYLGFLLDMAKKPIGFLILIGVPALAIVSDEVKKIYKEAILLRGKRRGLTQTKRGPTQTGGTDEGSTNAERSKREEDEN